MRLRSRVEVVVIGCLCLSAAPLGAQAVDMALMAKWSSVTVVHYVMTGEFTGDAVVMKSPRGVEAKPKVTDRVELTFNWNQHEMALVGPATVKNFPATVSFPARIGECPAPRVTTPYEGWDIVSVTSISGGGGLKLAGRWNYAAGAFPRAKPNVPASQEVCGDVWEPVAATSETAEMMVGVAPPLWYAMPSAGGEFVSVTKDGKSIVVIDHGTGWTWTYTATPVR
jgi:hypothetical protein